MRVGGAAALGGFALWRTIRTRHVRWVGMRLSRRDLVAWSFLMSTAHGAGLMLLAVLATTTPSGSGGAGGLAFFCPIPVPAAGGGTGGSLLLGGVAAVAVHAGAMLAVMAAIAVGVYSWLGVAFLRRAWFNLDRVWAIALLAAAAVLLVA